MAVATQIFGFETSRGHGTHDERLAVSSHEMAQRPRDPGPLLERAQVYREIGHRAEAEADLARAEALAPGLPRIALLRAQIHMDAREVGAAQAILDSLLERSSRNGEARALLAEALAAEGKTAQAATELERAIGDLEQPEPEHYLRLARLLAASEPLPRKREKSAIARGVERLGPAPALVDLAVELEMSQGRPDSALSWHDLLQPFMGTGPAWLARRGELLEAGGRKWEALAAFTAALEAIEALPARRRNTPETKALEAATRSRLRTLKPGRMERS